MTDKEIIKALCNCRRAKWCDDECPYYRNVRHGNTWEYCHDQLLVDAAQHIQTLLNNADIASGYISKQQERYRDLLNKQLKDLEKQLQDQKWHHGSEYPTEEKPYLVLILPCDMYGVPVSEKTCYEVVRWSSRFGWAMKRNGNVLYWQDLPKEPPEEDD